MCECGQEISDFGFIIDPEYIIVLTLVETILYSASIMKHIVKKMQGKPPFVIKYKKGSSPSVPSK